MNEIVINKHFSEHTKIYCVLGVLLSDEGIAIKNEMLEWLIPEYDVITVEQELPGKLYEYPAINYVVNLSKETNEICLYLHTKGAANSNGGQAKIRNMWKDEFINHKKEYLEETNTTLPLILCPFTGPNKTTWFNGFYITPAAANNTLPLMPVKNRHHWEEMYKENENVKVKGRLFNNIKPIKDEDNLIFLINYIKENYKV